MTRPEDRRTLAAGDRLIMALAVGGWGAFITYFAMQSHPQHFAKDFSYPWRAARALLDGQNPYEVIRAVGAYPFNADFLYPLPAALVAMPFSFLRPEVAGALFIRLFVDPSGLGTTSRLTVPPAPFPERTVRAGGHPRAMVTATDRCSTHAGISVLCCRQADHWPRSLDL